MKEGSDMSMRCPIEHDAHPEVLFDYCTGRLSPQTKDIVERHLSGCPGCRAFVAEQRQVAAALDEWEAEPISADFDRRLFARIAREKERDWTVRILSWAQMAWKPAVPLTVTACVAALLLVRLPAPAPHANPQPASVETVDVDQIQQTLDDLDMLRQLSAPPAASAPL